MDLRVNERYVIAIVFIFAVSVLAYLHYFSASQPKEFKFYDDPAWYVAVADSNAVVVRIVYPFSDPQPAVYSALYALQVFIFARKAVYFQVIQEGNCWQTVYEVNRPVEGNEDANVLTPTACTLVSTKYPTLQIQQGAPVLRLTPMVAYVQGPPEMLPHMTKYLIRRLYPNADYVEKLASELLNRAFSGRKG